MKYVDKNDTRQNSYIHMKMKDNDMMMQDK